MGSDLIKQKNLPSLTPLTSWTSITTIRQPTWTVTVILGIIKFAILRSFLILHKTLTLFSSTLFFLPFFPTTHAGRCYICQLEASFFFCSLSLSPPCLLHLTWGPKIFQTFPAVLTRITITLTLAHTPTTHQQRKGAKKAYTFPPRPRTTSAPEKLKRHSHFRFSSGDTSFRSYFCCETFEPLFFAWLGSGKCLPLILFFSFFFVLQQVIKLLPFSLLLLACTWWKYSRLFHRFSNFFFHCWENCSPRVSLNFYRWSGLYYYKLFRQYHQLQFHAMLKSQVRFFLFWGIYQSWRSVQCGCRRLRAAAPGRVHRSCQGSHLHPRAPEPPLDVCCWRRWIRNGKVFHNT